MSSLERFWAVIPAGGAGTRLWPLSRAASPKFLHDLTGTGRSLLQATWDRLEPLADDRVLVVTGVAHEAAVREQLPGLDPSRLLAEPSPRDSMAAIGLAAAVLEREDPDALLGSFAADHVIDDAEAFRACVRAAVEVADEGYLVTIGIEPTHPATGFGYIRAGAPVGEGPALAVEEFVEKPDAERAAAYVGSGRYRWNAGMFVVRAAVLLDLLEQWHPALTRGLRAIAADPSSLQSRWSGLERIAIDHAVAEPAARQGRVAVVPGTFGWDDVGDFHSLAGLLPDTGGTAGVRVLGDAALVRAVDATGVVVPGSGRTIAVVGLEDVVVVDTADAVLVTTRARAQDVKAVVDALKAEGVDGLL
jgi:mannose-1-phosphate guanylyltransferase